MKSPLNQLYARYREDKSQIDPLLQATTDEAKMWNPREDQDEIGIGFPRDCVPLLDF